MPYLKDRFEVDLNSVQVGQLDASPKVDPQELRDIVGNIRDVQHRVHNVGYTKDDFIAAERSGDPADAARLRSYQYIYEDAEGKGIEAEWKPEREGFEVTQGRHRVSEAKQQGLTHMQMTVRAPDADHFTSLREKSSERYGASFRDTPPNNREVGPSRPWLDAPESPESPSRSRER